ncbi:alpha/beta hydrolase [Phytoactinopolyspora alkaliphila]|uniref:Alpha/beta hydrolase n=1 Tax=Phytoactinopolyspora alkaliphila TaxID=1783498 RepID=A0A6N9YJE5_9ACTN|nr:alpha/beta hydrolase [Phytoactinopolyspora alkaliphila]
MVTETDIELDSGRVLHVYDTVDGYGPRHRDDDGDAPDDNGRHAPLAVFWHHGTPNIGEPPAPLFPAAEELGIRWVSYDRPGYGGSTRQPGRDIASAAADVAAVADALGIERLAVMGHSGGGPHAVACAALLPQRVVGAVSVSGLAPYGADGLEWFAGMALAGAAELRAATAGRAALEHQLTSSDFDPEQFTEADHAVLAGEWAWLGAVAGKALDGGLGGMVDDDLAYVSPWGFDPKQVTSPVLYLHGGRDRIAPSAHSEWLANRTRRAELWIRPDDGHISALSSAAAALAWLRQLAEEP